MSEYQNWKTDTAKISRMANPADFIWREMVERGLNPLGLARAAKMNVSTVHRILNEQGEPRRKTLEPLAAFFRCSVDDMYGDDLSRPPLSPEEEADKVYDDLMSLPPALRQRVLARIAASPLE